VRRLQDVYDARRDYIENCFPWNNERNEVTQIVPRGTIGLAAKEGGEATMFSC
jgi:hypothetical protein